MVWVAAFGDRWVCGRVDVGAPRGMEDAYTPCADTDVMARVRRRSRSWRRVEVGRIVFALPMPLG